MAVIALILTLFAAMASVVAAYQRSARVQVVADLVALAVSDIDRGVVIGRPCRDARAIGRDNGTRVVECVVRDGVGAVVVEGYFAGLSLHRGATAGPAAGGVWQGLG